MDVYKTTAFFTLAQDNKSHIAPLTKRLANAGHAIQGPVGVHQGHLAWMAVGHQVTRKKTLARGTASPIYAYICAYVCVYAHVCLCVFAK